MPPQAQETMNEVPATPSLSPGESVAAIFRILGWQAGAGLAAAAAILIIFGSVAGFSAALGAAICFVPSFMFGSLVAASVLWRPTPRLQLQGFYTGEAFKLAVTVLLFTIVFTTVRNLDPLFLFTGFIITQLTMMAMLLRG